MVIAETVAVKERGIIFSAEMVRALLEDRKTQTHRIAKFVPSKNNPGLNLSASSLSLGDYFTGNPEFGKVLYSMRGGTWNQVTERLFCPYGEVGSALWVREAFRAFDDGDTFYRADFAPDYIPVHADDEPEDWRWISPIYMPRKQSRITLEVTKVRVERLHEISEEDAKAEGVKAVIGKTIHGWTPHVLEYSLLWDKINGKPKYVNGAGFGGSTARFESGLSWKDNPWVWCLEFRRVK